MNYDLKRIKKKFGENMSKLCRELFPLILEEEGTLSDIMFSSFEPNRFLYNDITSLRLIDDFKNYVYGVYAHNNSYHETKLTPKELLDLVGYDLDECHSEEDIQKYKKYYAPFEEICTFNGGRLKRCHVFFAIKKDVDKIKRENFTNPRREDEYGTSVISIQFSRDSSHVLSIKNRYNHRVTNPDATFYNDLDNIIPGLTESFAKEYGLKQKFGPNDLEIFGYIRANDGKFYKYNYELYDKFYCPNNIVIENGKVKKFPKEQYLLLDYFLLDLKTKKMKTYDGTLIDMFDCSLGDIKKIDIRNIDKETKEISLIPDEGEEIIITLDGRNRIKGYKNHNLQSILYNFLRFNDAITDIDLPNVKKVCNGFLEHNETLEGINLPNAEIIGDDFLKSNFIINEVNLPSVVKIGNDFLKNAEELRELKLPNLEQVGNDFILYNERIRRLNLNNLQFAGYNFLQRNNALRELQLPNLKSGEEGFLRYNESIDNLVLNESAVPSEFMKCFYARHNILDKEVSSWRSL